MLDRTAVTPAPVDNAAGVAAMSRLADRLLAAVPPPVAASLASPVASRFSPAVWAALSRTAAISARAERRARRSILVGAIRGFVSACAAIPYALVGLGLRLVMAQVFFFDGQTRIDGVRYSWSVRGFDASVIVPTQVKAETLAAFHSQYAALPLPPALAAWLVSYAEFVLPVCLVLGLGTRFAALCLLAMMAMIDIYVMPQALWSQHIYWASILMVLISLGAGPISLDRVARFLARG